MARQIDMDQKDHNDKKILSAKEKERMEFTINAYNKYETHQTNIIQFLSEIGSRHQGKKL